MTYPILPLTPTWGNTEQEQADIAKTKYGKAGVEQRDFIGINPIKTSWDINVNIVNFQEVDDFLRSRRGQPFRLSLDGGITDDGKFYFCTEWQIQQLGVGVGDFSANIKQVRRFLAAESIVYPDFPPCTLIQIKAQVLMVDGGIQEFETGLALAPITKVGIYKVSGEGFYYENLYFEGARQDFNLCSNGEIISSSWGYSSTAPYAQEIISFEISLWEN